MQGRRLRGWPPDAFAVAITDECHHAAARSYQHIYNHFTLRSHVGLSATLDRHDRKSLATTYPDGVCFSYGLVNAVLDGYLVHPKAVRLPIRPDLRKCKVVAGDYVAADLGEALQAHLNAIATAVAAEIGDKRSLAFAPTVASATALATYLRAVGLRPTAVWGSDPERESKLVEFRRGHSGSRQLLGVRGRPGRPAD